MNVLIVPGTTLVAREICNSLGTMKGLRLFGAGYDITMALSLPYQGFDYVGALDSKNLIHDLEVIVDRRKIDFIIFAHDSWIYVFRNVNSIRKARLLKHSSNAIEICSFKSLTYEYLREDVVTPIVFKSAKDVSVFPVFLKPNRGQGSIGAFKIANFEELEPFMNSSGFIDDQWVVSEYLPGAEYTVDCFSAMDGEILYASPRIRSEIEFGLAVGTRAIELPELFKWAKVISKKLLLNGAWFFQVKEDSKGLFKLMEIGLRIAGGSGIQRLKGVNLSQMNILQSQGAALEVIDQNNFPSKLKKDFDLNFNYEKIYVDLDDTLIVNFNLNHELIAFLKSESDRGTPISLITRHKGNLQESLVKFGIGELFNRIIHVTELDPKSRYIDSDVNFLFIDDSFRERRDVSIHFGKQGLVLDESFLKM